MGRGFAPPKSKEHCLLVGQGHATGQLYFLAETLRALGKRVDMVLSGQTHDAIYNPIEGKRVAKSVTLVTSDGTMGTKGEIVDSGHVGLS